MATVNIDYAQFNFIVTARENVTGVTAEISRNVTGESEGGCQANCWEEPGGEREKAVSLSLFPFAF